MSARVAATRFGAVRHRTEDASYSVKTMVEYVILFGTAQRSGKIEIDVDAPHNEPDFRQAVVEDIVSFLRAKYPEDNFRKKDVLLFGF